MSDASRWYVKKEGSASCYALCDTQQDAELLARNLSRATGDVYYAKKVER